MKRALLFYFGEGTGHHAAARAIGDALHQLVPNIQTIELDSLRYTHPFISKVVMRTYLGIIKRTPEFWDYLYDSVEIQKRTKKFRDAIRRAHSIRLTRLLNEFRPEIVICTQAFSCGVMAECKRTGCYTAPLVGVLTDFMPHLYWAYPETDLYTVPSEKSGQALVNMGVTPQRIRVTGIPIARQFADLHNKELLCARLGLLPRAYKVLVMGGSHGLGPLRPMIRAIDRIERPFEMIAVTGLNERLQGQLANLQPRLRHRLHLLGFADTIDQIMEVADILVTKPGGLTTAEALAKRLPMIITQPLPGQEIKNTEFLLARGVAVRANTAREVAAFVQQFFDRPERVQMMRQRMESLRRPQAARDIARAALELAR